MIFKVVIISFMFLVGFEVNALNIEPSKIDFGTFPANERKEASVKIYNTGDSPVKILNVRNTCSCIETRIDKQKIQPDGSTELKIVLIPEGIYGEFNKNIYVETNSKDERFMCIGLYGNSLPLIKVRPEAEFNAGILKKNTIFQKEFELKGSLHIDNIELGQPICKGNIQVKMYLEEKDKECFLLKYIINTGSQSQKFDSEILIPILKPVGWQPIHINITGVIGAVVEAIPAKVKFANLSGKGSKNIRLRFQGIEYLEISKLTWNSIRGIEVLPQKASDNEIKIRLMISDLSAVESKSELKFAYPGTSGVCIQFE